MLDRVTTGLDVLGLLLIAAGVAAVLFPVLGWGGLAGAGVVVLFGSWWAATNGAHGKSSGDQKGGTG